MSKIAYYSIATACIVVSIGVIVGSYQIGLERVMAGQDALVWLHVGAFLVALSLVVVAIVATAKARR
jgi:hypothetical protein